MDRMHDAKLLSLVAEVARVVGRAPHDCIAIMRGEMSYVEETSEADAASSIRASAKIAQVVGNRRWIIHHTMIRVMQVGAAMCIGTNHHD